MADRRQKVRNKIQGNNFLCLFNLTTHVCQLLVDHTDWLQVDKVDQYLHRSKTTDMCSRWDGECSADQTLLRAGQLPGAKEPEQLNILYSLLKGLTVDHLARNQTV